MLKFSRFPKSLLRKQVFFCFSEKSDPNKVNNTSSNASERSQFEQFTDSFFKLLKQNDKKYSEANIDVDYRYYSRTIYHNKVDPQIFKSNTRYRLVGGVLWMLIGYASFIYIHPLITVLPAWFASGCFLGYFLGNSYAKKLVYQMDLSPDQKYLTLYVAKGNKSLNVKIEDMDLFDIAELKSKNDKKEKADSEQPKQISNYFVAIFDAKDEKGKSINGLRAFINPSSISIENMDLFKQILVGNQEEVEKFHYVDENEKKKEEKELDEKISEEFERIKKESEQTK